MTIINATFSEQVSFVEVGAMQSAVPHYGTLNKAANYFLSASDWIVIPDPQKTNLLVQATRRIDALSYAGNKLAEDQELEFPRDIETISSERQLKDVEEACYLIAMHLHKNGETNKRVAVASTGGVRVQYTKTLTPAETSGIFDEQAWLILEKYLEPIDFYQTNLERLQ